MVHDAAVEQSIVLGAWSKEPHMIHFETGEVTRAERERFEQMLHEAFQPAVQQLTQSIMTTFQAQDLMQGAMLRLNEVIAPLANGLTELVNNSLARQMSELTEATRNGLAAALQPMLQVQAGLTKQISEQNRSILNLAVELSRLAAEASRRPDETNPRYHVLNALSNEQYWVYQAARRQTGYFTPESLSETEGLPYETIHTTLPLLETLGLIIRISVLVSPDANEVYFVEAFKKPGESADSQVADLAFLNNLANQAT